MNAVALHRRDDIKREISLVDGLTLLVNATRYAIMRQLFIFFLKGNFKKLLRLFKSVTKEDFYDLDAEQARMMYETLEEVLQRINDDNELSKVFQSQVSKLEEWCATFEVLSYEGVKDHLFEPINKEEFQTWQTSSSGR